MLTQAQTWTQAHKNYKMPIKYCCFIYGSSDVIWKQPTCFCRAAGCVRTSWDYWCLSVCDCVAMQQVMKLASWEGGCKT